MADGAPDPVSRKAQMQNALAAAGKLLQRMDPQREHAVNVSRDDLEGLRTCLRDLGSKALRPDQWQHTDWENIARELFQTLAKLAEALPAFQLQLLNARDRLLSEQLRMSHKAAWAAGSQRTL